MLTSRVGSLGKHQGRDAVPPVVAFIGTGRARGAASSAATAASAAAALAVASTAATDAARSAFGRARKVARDAEAAARELVGLLRGGREAIRCDQQQLEAIKRCRSGLAWTGGLAVAARQSA